VVWLWCGWACPAGALQEFGQPINNKPTPGGKFNWVKWVIWVPWMGLIVALAIGAGGYNAVDFLYQLETGVTMTLPLDGGGPPWFFIYYIIIALFLGLALIFGRRAGCHTICWMAPFMIIGRSIRYLFKWPALRLVAEAANCSNCQTCTRNCPMSLDVNGMVQQIGEEWVVSVAADQLFAEGGAQLLEQAVQRFDEAANIVKEKFKKQVVVYVYSEQERLSAERCRVVGTELSRRLVLPVEALKVIPRFVPGLKPKLSKIEIRII